MVSFLNEEYRVRSSDAVKRRAICVKKTIQKKTKKTQKIKTKQAS
jgi:hypothetical protein